MLETLTALAALAGNTVVTAATTNAWEAARRKFAQLRLGAPVAALPGQRFILRGFAVLEGRGKTVGGGRVLAVAAPKRRRGRPEGLRQLEVLARGDGDARAPEVRG